MLTLSNHDVPPPEQLSYLHDFVARSVAGLQFTPIEKTRFAFELVCRGLVGDTVVGSARYSATRIERTRELTADGRQNYMLTLHDADYEVSITGGRRVGVSKGDIMIVNESLRQSFNLPETRLTAVVLDRRQMAELAPAIGSRPFHHIPAAAPGAALIAGYARLLLDGIALDDAGARLAASQLHQLAALAIDGRDDPLPIDLPGVGGARLALIRTDVARHLDDHELDIASVARRHGVTPRYVQRLFERAGTTFGEFLRNARLDAAHAALAARNAATIATIAFDCGFGDLSHFNRTFRQRFGRTPRDVRAAALRRMN
ncbi:helix-turn-helix transcriptional regulator [Mesorhizobium sp. ZMM04-5]|uniref:Helix-turn-helix transcriptional regulator n=1 Tax=Mesorhizobium marinum TaxID=3228790 RepID=A0ABV3QUK4_9HYPH